FVSGCAVNEGLNCSRLQPFMAGLCEVSVTYRRCCHESVLRDDFSGPVHEVGFVKNGVSGAPLEHGVTLPGQTRSASWLGSAGTPHRVTVIPLIGSSVGMLDVVTVSP